MPTNLDLDDWLIQEAQRIGAHKSKKAAVNAALEEYIKRRKQAAIIDLFGKVDFDSTWNYKAARRRQRP
jgi:Bacterial antitoxin of type II TA system, VapB